MPAHGLLVTMYELRGNILRRRSGKAPNCESLGPGCGQYTSTVKDRRTIDGRRAAWAATSGPIATKICQMCKQKEEVPVRLLAGGIRKAAARPARLFAGATRPAAARPIPTSVPLPIRTAVARSARLLAVRITTAAAMLAHPLAGGMRTGAAGPARLVAPGTGTTAVRLASLLAG